MSIVHSRSNTLSSCGASCHMHTRLRARTHIHTNHILYTLCTLAAKEHNRESFLSSAYTQKNDIRACIVSQATGQIGIYSFASRSTSCTHYLQKIFRVWSLWSLPSQERWTGTGRFLMTGRTNFDEMSRTRKKCRRHCLFLIEKQILDGGAPVHHISKDVGLVLVSRLSRNILL